jgi:hypothetical protein
VAALRSSATPVRLKVLLYATWAVAALLFLVGEGALAGAGGALKTVGKDSAPSIIAAQEIGSGLADLDANAGNFLLGNKVHQALATEAFEKRRVQVTMTLVSAAKNITFGDAETKPINNLFDGLGRYLELVAEMRYRKELADQVGAVRTYEVASDLLHQRLLPAADALDAANRHHLDLEYQQQQQRSGAEATGAAIVGVVLVALLVLTQLFLARRVRRIFNVPLLAASLVAAGYTVYLVASIAVARADLHAAKEDAFESIHALWKARALAYDANGDETRYLLGPERAATFEREYKDKVLKLTSRPRLEAAALQAKALPAGLSGLFADELRNITFPGEREAAVKMAVAFGAYDRLDEQIRDLERAGKHEKAVDLCIGAGSDQSNAAFERFDLALHQVVEINKKEFDTIVEDGLRALGVAKVLGPLASLLVAFLALLGVRARLREYAA